MRIKEIQVKNLFGMFDHSIPLGLDSRITIIYGENGIGKTMIFRILNSFFSKDFKTLISLPFESFRIIFDNDGTVDIKKNNDGQIGVDIDGNQKGYLIEQTDGAFDEQDILSLNNSETEALIDDFRSWVNNNYKNKSNFHRTFQLIRELDDMHILPKHIRSKTLVKILTSYPEFSDERWRKTQFACPKEVSELIDKFSLFLIETNRLFLDSFEISDFAKIAAPKRINSVVKLSKDLSYLIRQKHAEYQKKTEILESSLRSRLTSGDVQTEFADADLKKISEQVAMRRKELEDVGLLDDSDDEGLPIDENLNEISRAILGVNLVDMKAKLAVYDDTYEKLKLFLSIINQRRFSFKTLAINHEQGFIFQNVKGDRLSLEDLSSGEQHELVLLFQLIFKVPENSLILLDEPEISLHITWQKEFIKDMQEIIELRGFDLIIATHSPSIINGKWDLTVSLKGELVHG